MRQYIVVYERGKPGQENWGAFVPDLPGLGTTGETFEEVQANIREAIAFHIEGMIANGETIPEPSALLGTVEIAA